MAARSHSKVCPEKQQLALHRVAAPRKRLQLPPLDDSLKLYRRLSQRDGLGCQLHEASGLVGDGRISGSRRLAAACDCC